MVDQGGI